MDDQQPKAEPEKAKAIEVVPGKNNEPPPPTDNVASHFEALGRQFAATAQAAWHSDQRQEVQKDLTNGVQAMRDHLDTLLDQLRSDKRTSGVIDQAEEMADSVRDSGPADDVRKNLSHMSDFLSGKVREAGERFDRPDGDSKKD